MGLEDTNLPSSQFAGFPNKVTFLLPLVSGLSGLLSGNWQKLGLGNSEI